MLKSLLYQLTLEGKQIGTSTFGKSGVNTAGDLTRMTVHLTCLLWQKIHGISTAGFADLSWRSGGKTGRSTLYINCVVESFAM